MYKRIHVDHLCLGMFIHEFCGSWMEHPFWRTAFLLEDPEDLRRIRDSGILEVWIDTGRGKDVASPEQILQEEDEAEREVDATLQASIDAGRAPEATLPRSVARELEKAALICARARNAVVDMFSEARMGRAIDARSALPLVEEISASVQRNPHALVSLARLKHRDDYTYMHSVAVCGLMVSLARQLGLGDEHVREAGLAGLLHDLGKAMIPLDILNKPGKLTDAEFDAVRRHPAEGHALLVEGRGVGEIPLDVCLHHHEKTDGTGYPHRLKGEEISLFARMGAVCDVYDAVTSNRPYKAGWEPADALRKMASWAKGHFDERIFQAFVKTVGIYPVGSLVRLQSGLLGIVTEQHATSLLSPLVKVFFSTKSRHQIRPEVVDLGRPGCQDRIVAHEDPAAWGFQNLEVLLRA